MKIGIVIPVFNGGATIRETIDSILGQGYPNVDLVVMDGGSTDDTVSIAESYGDYLRCISEPDHGQTDAINKGMALLDADIVKWVNADDLLCPGALHKVAEYFKANPSKGFVYGDIDFIDEQSELVGTHFEPRYSPFIMLFGHNLFADPAAFWRMSVWEQLGSLDIHNRFSMDYEMWVRLYFNGTNFGSIRHTLAQYRIAADNASIKNQRIMRREHFEILRRHSRVLARLPHLILLPTLNFLLFFARIYKKMVVMLQRNKFDIYLFKRTTNKLM